MKKAILSLIIPTLILLSSCNDIKSFDDVKGVTVRFKSDAELLVRKQVIGSVRSGETVEVIADDFLAFQVKKKNGDIGWVRKRFMPVGKTAQIGDREKMGTRALYSEIVYNPYISEDKIIMDLDKSYDGKEVAILQDKIYGEHHWAEIKLPDGKTGWTLVDWLLPCGKLKETLSGTRYNGSKLWLFNIEKLQKKAENKDSQWLQKKFGFPSGKVAIIPGQDNGAYYYENIELYKGKSSGLVTYFYLKDDKVVEVGITGMASGKISSWLPLSKMVRGFGFGNTYRNLPNVLYGSDNLFKKDGIIDKILPGILYWPIYIVVLILVLGIGLAYTMLPIVAVTLMVSIRSMNKNVSTSSLILIQGIAGVLLGHLWFLFLIYHDAYFYREPFLAILFLPIIGTLVIAFMMKTLEYNRCPNCNYWSGFGIGSIWLSSHTSTKTTTTDHYQGDNYVGSSVKKETTVKDKYEDLRRCENCGHEWSIIREETK